MYTLYYKINISSPNPFTHDASVFRLQLNTDRMQSASPQPEVLNVVLEFKEKHVIRDQCILHARQKVTKRKRVRLLTDRCLLFLF